MLADKLASQPDFTAQTTLIHDTVRKHCPHDRVEFYPKYHCELPAIERYFFPVKQYIRKYCKYNIAGLREAIPRALDSVCGETVRVCLQSAGGMRQRTAY